MPDVSYLAKYPPFKTFDGSDLEALGSVGEEKTFQKEELIFDEDSKGDSMYVIKNGTVKIQKKVKNQENTIAVLNPGEFFGEMALAGWPTPFRGSPGHHRLHRSNDSLGRLSVSAQK